MEPRGSWRWSLVISGRLSSGGLFVSDGALRGEWSGTRWNASLPGSGSPPSPRPVREWVLRRGFARSPRRGGARMHWVNSDLLPRRWRSQMRRVASCRAMLGAPDSGRALPLREAGRVGRGWWTGRAQGSSVASALCADWGGRQVDLIGLVEPQARRYRGRLRGRLFYR